jgi:hypothetical protein
LLLSSTADVVNRSDMDCATALHYEAQEGVIGLLLAAGAGESM